MVSSGAGGSHGRCVLLVFTLLCCGAGYLLFRHLSLSALRIPLGTVSWHGNRALTDTPFTSFIDPDLSHLQHMFSSVGMEREAMQGPAFTRQSAARAGQRAEGHNVTVFHGQDGQQYNTCVPFHAPANRTLRICVYEREVDQMISAYLQDHGVWEKEQVEGMAYLLRRHHSDTGPTGRTVSVVAPESDRHLGDADLSQTHQNLTMPLSWREGEGPQDRRLSVVDVGCNVGVYTLAAASLGHEVLALDPLQPNLQLLDTSLRLAGLRAHVTLLLNAVTDFPGPVQVHVNNGNIGGSSVSRNQRYLPKVWALCLNHLVPLVPTRRLLLKLDIEGWEARALRCAGHFFQELDVRYVLMEWVFFRNQRAGADVIEFMIRNGLLPYSDVTQTTMLSPDIYYSWPDNVWWIKR